VIALIFSGKYLYSPARKKRGVCDSSLSRDRKAGRQASKSRKRGKLISLARVIFSLSSSIVIKRVKTPTDFAATFLFVSAILNPQSSQPLMHPQLPPCINNPKPPPSPSRIFLQPSRLPPILPPFDYETHPAPPRLSPEISRMGNLPSSPSFVVILLRIAGWREKTGGGRGFFILHACEDAALKLLQITIHGVVPMRRGMF
jgi:hypothetical protein